MHFHEYPYIASCVMASSIKHFHEYPYYDIYVHSLMPHAKALLRLYQGSIKAVSRQYKGSIKALPDEPRCGVAGWKRLV